jgi:acetyl esterase/lipase
MLGFSAGGHLTAATSTNYDKRAYTPIDDIDKVSCRPDFAILVYPGYLVQKGTTDLNADIRVTSETPPCFFAHAANDGVEPENSIGMFLALKKAKVPSELHIFSTGGHGFGLRSTDVPCTKWPKKCEEWLRIQGILKKG